MLLEIIEPLPTSESNAFFEEILMYIKTLLSYAPRKSVVCIRQLIKLMFSLNYRSRKLKENLFDFKKLHEFTETEIFECLENYKSIPTADVKGSTETPSTSNSGLKLINFLASPSTPEKTKKNASDSKNIKIFEPLVIQCLKVEMISFYFKIDIQN